MFDIPSVFSERFNPYVLTTIFEQYITMIINPDVNGTLIANMTDPEYSKEWYSAQVERQGVPVYLYHNNIMVHKFKFVTHVSRVLGFTDSWAGTKLDSAPPVQWCNP